MTESAGAEAWDQALHAAALFAIDPVGLGGIVVRAHPGPVRDQWIEIVREMMGKATHFQRLPLHISDDRLLGGLDLATTLQVGRAVAGRGILAEADGGVLLVPMAERMEPGTAGRLAAVLDTGEVTAERDGLTQRHQSRLSVIALDESETDGEHVPAALTDRLAFAVDLRAVGIRDVAPPDVEPRDIERGAQRLGEIAFTDQDIEAICATTVVLGVDSGRAPTLTLKAACAAAAVEGRDHVTPEDVATAAQLVLSHRATTLPAETPEEEQPDDAPPDQPEEPDAGQDDETRGDDPPLDDLVLEAARSAIPPGLLSQLLNGGLQRQRSRSQGRIGPAAKSRSRGRPIGVRPGDLRAGVRLNVLATIRTAAPWQRLRGGNGKRLRISKDDFRISRFKQSAGTTTIFVVDASGSLALNRLAETKGAVELLLAECYVRRDSVALIAFRNQTAEVLLPPTRSLVRAKRRLAGLPGGGGTPLAAALECAAQLADAVKRSGETPIIVLMTDGRANITRSGDADRQQARADAQAMADIFRAQGLRALLIDVSRQPHPQAQALANDMGALYCPLPYADSAAVSKAVKVFTTNP